MSVELSGSLHFLADVVAERIAIARSERRVTIFASRRLLIAWDRGPSLGVREGTEQGGEK